MLRALVIDDEQYVREDLRHLLRAHPDVCVAWEASNLAEARAALTAERPDLVLLDVQLQGASGFDLVADLPPDVPLVFVTAFDQYAVRAFEVNALDYLLKPIHPARLAEALVRVRLRRSLVPAPMEPPVTLMPDDRLLIRDSARHEFVHLTDIEAIGSVGGNYTCVSLVDGSTLDTRRTFKQWEAMLPKQTFVRIHRMVIVNLRHVSRVNRDYSGALEVVMASNQRTYPVSRRFAPQLRALLERVA